MTTLLAETAPAAALSWLESFFWLVGGIAALLGCAVAVRSLGEKSQPLPQPLVTQEHTKLASQSDIDQLHGRIKRERMELDQKIADLKEEDRRLREKLDGEIRDMNERIDKVPERTIELLKITKGLID